MSLDIHTIYQAQPVAKQLFDWILRSGVEDSRTTVQELIEQLDVPRKTAIQLLRALAEAGHGEFKVGRKGHPSRLEWSDDPHTLAERLRGADERAVDDHDPSDARSREDDVEPSADTGDHDHDHDQRSGSPDRPLAPGVRSTPRRRNSNRGAKQIEHSYVLRPQLRVVIALPEDLSAREAEVLAGWIRNLSFER